MDIIIKDLSKQSRNTEFKKKLVQFGIYSNQCIA